MSETRIDTPLTLPCGATLSNRLAKAAMTEGLADRYDDATPELERLYRHWSLGGAALHITGNVQVDRRYLERPGNVVLDEQTDLERIRRWTAAGTEGGNHLWAQLGHPGRQCSRTVNREPVAPSEVQLQLMGLFAKPRVLESDEIRDLVQTFGRAAAMAREGGFTGIQIHAAHGYLISQFLSPAINRREDEWGGSLENRARFLLGVVEAARARVGKDFPICVKLNSADFQKGGFSNEDSAQVAAWLGEAGIDLLEVSGGTYESFAFFDGAKDRRAESTRRREVFFLEYAKLIREAVNVPMMVTGGFRTREVMNEVLAEGSLDVIGLGRPFCLDPNVAHKLIRGQIDVLPSPERDMRLGPERFGMGMGSSNKAVRGLNSQAQVAWFYEHIYALADARPLPTKMSARTALRRHFAREGRVAMARKRRGRRA